MGSDRVVMGVYGVVSRCMVWMGQVWNGYIPSWEVSKWWMGGLAGRVGCTLLVVWWRAL